MERTIEVTEVTYEVGVGIPRDEFHGNVLLYIEHVAEGETISVSLSPIQARKVGIALYDLADHVQHYVAPEVCGS
jgi:hypothetical protein